MVRSVTAAAGQAHAIPVIVAYNLPGPRRLRQAVGRAGLSAAGYEQWIDQLAGAIGAGHDIVIVEPDGLPDIVRGCLSPARPAERYQLLRYAMQKLGALPHARVYLDAGNPGMFTDPARLAGPLAAAGIARRPRILGQRVELRLDRGPGGLEPAAGARPRRHGRRGHRHQPQRPRPVHRPEHAAVVQSPGPRARAGAHGSTPARPGSTPICGSRTRGPATARAAAGRPRARSGSSTRWAWPRPARRPTRSAPRPARAADRRYRCSSRRRASEPRAASTNR